MTPVICVTEFSELTLEAARVADALARRWNERVVLVRSVDEREQFALPLRARLVEQDWRRLAKESQQLRQHGFAFEERVLRGMPEDGIAAFAWKSGARLIVVGCQPTARVEHWALGCMAEEISDTSLVPVLAVRSAQPFERWLAGERQLNLFAVIDPAARPDALLHRIDELREISACTMQAAFAPYPEHEAEPGEAVPTAPDPHAFNPDFLRAISDELAARDVRATHVDPGRDSASSLAERAREAGADLLVITSHPRNDLTILPHRTLSHEVLRRARMSVFCVPESAIEPARTAVSNHSSLRSDDGDSRRSLRQPAARNETP